MFKKEISKNLEKNRILLNKAFDSLNNILEIKAHNTNGSNNTFWHEFSYYTSINGWSHSVLLMADENKVYLKALVNDTEKNRSKFESFINTDCIKKDKIRLDIPVSNTKLIIEMLTEYDRFKYKNV